MDEYSLSCGPYQIKEPYWIDCGRPGTGKYLLMMMIMVMITILKRIVLRRPPRAIRYPGGSRR